VTSSSKGFFESEQQFNYLNDLYLLIYRLTENYVNYIGRFTEITIDKKRIYCFQ